MAGFHVALRLHGRQVHRCKARVSSRRDGPGHRGIANIRAKYPALADCHLPGRSAPRGGRQRNQEVFATAVGPTALSLWLQVRTAESLLTFTRAGAPTRLRV
jgi:hypothetical protein